MANNTSYIVLSHQIAKEQQLDVVANNAANINSNGFEQQDIIFGRADYKQNKKNYNSMVYSKSMYKSNSNAPIIRTNNPTDLVIAESGYFKILTDRGPRYTLDGNFYISNENILIHSSGFPVSSQNDAEIELPETTERLQVMQDGTIFAGDEAVEAIGVYNFADDSLLTPEGDNLYRSGAEEIALEDFTIISGALRKSNVEQVSVMAKMVELQRAAGDANNMMNEIHEVEKSTITQLQTK